MDNQRPYAAPQVCTKVASFLEQGQRLENLSWRLWHLQNLMVETDDAKSKHEFRKLLKCMSDKSDEEKGRSIEELQAPGSRRNHSTDIIQQCAIEKEREHEAQSGRPGIHRMQFTFSVDQPLAPTGHSPPAQKPDLKLSPEFKDNCAQQGIDSLHRCGGSCSGAARSYGDHKANFKAVETKYNAASRLIDVTVFEPRHDVSVPLQFQFEYKPSMGFAAIHEIAADHNKPIKVFYWKLWFGDNEILPEID
ncbi:hypothetical protein PHLCEN_2v4600, partial [Hermanssonia centrifuga]